MKNKYPNLNVQTEPIDKWQNHKNINLLALLYEDPSKWLISFQFYVFLTFLQIPKSMSTLNIIERSIHSAKHIFIENMKNNKTIEIAQYNILNDWYSFICETYEVQTYSIGK